MHLCCKIRVMLCPEMGRREPPACPVLSCLCWLHSVTSDFKGASENLPVGFYFTWVLLSEGQPLEPVSGR